MTNVPRKARHWSGWLLMTIGAGLISYFWLWLVPVFEAYVPDYVPHLSPQGFWRAKQRALKRGVWRHEDPWMLGFYGDKEWAEKIIASLRDGTRIPGFLWRDRFGPGEQDYSLTFITNHRVFGQDIATSWQRRWEENRELSQEQWIRKGFAERGIDIALPPSKDDWPKLLTVLGAAAGPSERSYETVEPLYPDHVRYNAYRWLRDSGFDPVEFAISDQGKQLSVEPLAGLLAYGAHTADLFTPSPPGRLAFAPMNDWGMIGRGPESAPFVLKPLPQTVLTGSSLTMMLGGWLLARKGKKQGILADSPPHQA